MRFAFTEEQQFLRDSARAILQAKCTSGHVRAAWSSPKVRLDDAWKQLAEAGIFGMTVGQSSGGLGLTEIDSVLFFEETGRAALPGPIVEHLVVGLPLFEKYSSESQRKKWMPQLLSGEATLTARLDSSPFVAHAADATLLLLADDSDLHMLTSDEVDVELQPGVDGAHRVYRATWEPSARTRLAADASAAIEIAFERGVIATSAQLLGLAQRLLDSSVQYANTRTQFGRAVGSFQALKHQLANVLVKLEFARPVVYRAAYALAHDSSDSPLLTSMAKIYATDAAQLASRTALQVHGAIGYSYEHDLHLFMKRVWALATSYGTRDFHFDRVATRTVGVNP